MMVYISVPRRLSQEAFYELCQLGYIGSSWPVSKGYGIRLSQTKTHFRQWWCMPLVPVLHVHSDKIVHNKTSGGAHL